MRCLKCGTLCCHWACILKKCFIPLPLSAFLSHFQLFSSHFQLNSRLSYSTPPVEKCGWLIVSVRHFFPPPAVCYFSLSVYARAHACVCIRMHIFLSRVCGHRSLFSPLPLLSRIPISPVCLFVFLSVCLSACLFVCRTTPKLRQTLMNNEPNDFAPPVLCPKLYPKGVCDAEIVSLSKESNMKALRQVCACVCVSVSVRACAYMYVYF